MACHGAGPAGIRQPGPESDIRQPGPE